MKHLIAVLLLSASFASAQSIYSGGHADIGLAYEDGELIPHWHLDNGAIVDGQPLPDGGGHEYMPDELIAQVGTTRASASGSDAYLGVAPGTPVYVAGLLAYQPYLGFGTEELNPLEWSGDITVTLTGFTTPDGGQFALYTTNASGATTVDITLSTYDPSTANSWGLGNNVFGIGVGGHDHYQFGFTLPGQYSITLNFTGNHLTDGPVSGSATFDFNVVPEPSTYALIALGVGLILFRFRRRLA